MDSLAFNTKGCLPALIAILTLSVVGLITTVKGLIWLYHSFTFIG